MKTTMMSTLAFKSWQKRLTLIFLRSIIANEVNFLLMKTFCAFYLGLWLNDDDEDDEKDDDVDDVHDDTSYWE